MGDRRLLISFAHPDDESFGLGAFIGKMVAEGTDVYYICATNGDVGTVSPEMLDGYSSIAELRLAELNRANEVLKFREMFLLGYKDSGMMGSPTTQDPACLWQAPREEVARRVVGIIRQIQPQVIITFNEYGGYGHPDHIAIQRATVDAFTLAADPAYETGQPAYAPQKLYYNSIPSFILRLGIAQMRLQGKDPRRVGRNQDIDLVAIIDNIDPVHAKVNIRDYLAVWDKASDAHRSQLGGRTSTRRPMWFRRLFQRDQGFTRVFPKPARDVVDERDLFAGVKAAPITADAVSAPAHDPA
jgi:LmbE family N-acetylglucosaminyl deacetylase